MTAKLDKQLTLVLRHLYINPLEKCNLRCAICYTRKTSPILADAEIERFVDAYRSALPLQTVTFCGGEVFTLPTFPSLVNAMTGRGILVQIITNGTIDRLESIVDPNLVNLIVSLDGLPDYHDRNRGHGNFAKSTGFLKKAHRRGFHTEVFSIVTKENYPHIDAFETRLASVVGVPLTVTYHPRKPPSYLTHHPVSNIYGRTDGFTFLDETEMIGLLKQRKTFPPRDLGCYQIALTSDGRVFGCCEGPSAIGTIDDPIPTLVAALRRKLEQWDARKFHAGCLGCSYPEFLCGMHRYYQLLAATKTL
jgi:MoaA/NifB/PqqE/SkfB family radical SAM enzyme